MTINPIAYLRGGFQTKFGIPRQAGIVPEIISEIVFEKEYCVPEATRGLENFTHIWLIWDFSDNHRSNWSPTVRPPRLGGNTRVGVFATRSSFRPNPLGLSCVRLLKIKPGKLLVSGADLKDGTPIFDIKPYLPAFDMLPEATGVLHGAKQGAILNVEIPQNILSILPEHLRTSVIKILAEDPRPAYQDAPDRTYAFTYFNYEIKFSVSNTTLFVSSIENICK